MKNLKPFLKEAEKKSFDLGHRKRINHNISKYDAKVPEGKMQFEDFELARDQAAYIKRKVINNLEKFLLEFELNSKKNGTNVLWAATKQEALDHILTILMENNCKSVVKSKSMISEELDLNKTLEKNNIEPIETDLGEFIVQLDEEPPYHIVTPAMHKSKEDIADLFNRKLNTPLDFTPEKLTMEARNVLRDKFIEADAGITGANFLLADVGGISVTENEGNARMVTALPKIHIVIAGIERIIPSIKDLPLFLPLLSTMGTGQRITSYNTVFFGPKKTTEIDGPEQMHVILIDNGRTSLLSKDPQREALACIRCGACLNTCPVYKNIGGHTYKSPYNGPIGSVITPYIRKFEDNIHLSYASSLCGSCSSVCPVKIPIHDLLIRNKHDHVKDYDMTWKENKAWSFVTKVLTSRKLMNSGNTNFKNFVVSVGGKSTWNKRKEPLKFPSKTFNQMWKEKHKK